MNKKNTPQKIVYYSAILFVIMTITLISTAAIQKEYVFLEIKYQNNEFSLVEKKLEKGFYSTLEHDQDQAYKIKITNEQTKLYENSFDPTQLFSDAIIDEEMSGGVIKIDDATFYLIVPSLTEGKTVQITKDNTVVFQETIYDVGAQNCRIQ